KWRDDDPVRDKIASVNGPTSGATRPHRRILLRTIPRRLARAWPGQVRAGWRHDRPGENSNRYHLQIFVLEALEFRRFSLFAPGGLLIIITTQVFSVCFRYARSIFFG